jgi:hypothetical protein
VSSAVITYYRAVAGAWRARFELRIVDRAAIRALPLFERVSFLLLARISAWGFPLWFETTVAVGGDRVVHTSRLRLARVLLYRSVEFLTPDADGGVTATMVGTERTFPLFQGRPFRGTARIAPNALGARYDIAWMGTRLDQHATHDPVAHTVTIEQRTPFSIGIQVLQRADHQPWPR